jgi:hypothetical protein
MATQRLWVHGQEVMDRTGWDWNHMRKAREMGWVKFRGKGRSIQYDLRSIPPEFLKQKVA